MASDNPALNFVEYMKGVGDSAVNIAKESAFGVYDFGQVAVGGAKIAAKEGLDAAGLGDAAAKIVIEDIKPLSALGKIAASGGYEGLGNAVKDMPANMANAVTSAVDKGDMRALGTAVTDAVMLAEGGRATVAGAGKNVAGAARALKAKLSRPAPVTPAPAAPPGTAAAPAAQAEPAVLGPKATVAEAVAPPAQQAKTARTSARKAANPATSNSACPSCKKNNNVSARAAKKNAARAKAKAKSLDDGKRTAGEAGANKADPKYGNIPDEHQWRYDRYLAGPSAKKLAPDDWYKAAQRAWTNNANGNGFEQAVRQELGAPLGAGSKPVSIQGYVPDLPVGPQYGVADVKNVVNLSNSDQLRAFHQHALDHNLPFNSIVGPRTQSISEPLLNNIRQTGGSVTHYDPMTRQFTPIDIGPSGPWRKK